MTDNTDILIFTSIVAVLFLVFIIATVREFNQAGKADYSGLRESGPRADLMHFIGGIFDDDRLDIKKKIRILDAVKSVMEDDNVSENIDTDFPGSNEKTPDKNLK
jgi:hypothetical protein